MTTLELVTVEAVDARTAEVDREVAQARAQAEAMQVHDDASRDQAAEVLREIKRRGKAAGAERVALTKPLNDHVREINRKFKEAAAPYDEADRILREKVDGYEAEQERIRKAEEERLRKEREERERKAREAREAQERAERERREQAERDAREAAQIAQEARDEEERAQAEELAEEARQKAEEAKTAESAIQQLPDVKLPDAVVPAAPKAEGISNRTKREAFVVDRSKLPDALPDGTPLVVVDMVALRRWMNEQWTANDEPPELPGAEFKRVPDGLAVRG